MADSATIHLDRRLAATDTLESAVGEIEALPSVQSGRRRGRGARLRRAELEGSDVSRPRSTIRPGCCPRITRCCAAGTAAYEQLFGDAPEVGRWVFSTNGVAVMGMHGIPCIGFGPGNEMFAHMATEQIPVEHLVKAAAWYAAFAGSYTAGVRG